MHSAWLRSAFVRHLMFPQINERGTYFLGGGDNSADSMNYLGPFSVYQFQNLEVPKFFVIP